MAAKRKQKITPRALLELKMPSDVQVAPDGQRIAYSVSETDWDGNRITQHLYVTTTSEDTAPRQITRGSTGESTPLWSPDGKWLAFLTSREDDGADDEGDYDDDEPKNQIWLLPMDGLGGEAEKLTDASEGVGAFDWLPDASSIVYLAREPRQKPLQAAYDDRQDRKDDAIVDRDERFRSQIWRIGVEDKKPTLIHTGDYGVGELAVSPDGKWVAFSTNYTGEINDYHKADIWTVSIKSGRVRQLTDGPGGKYHPQWTPDGTALLFLSTLDPQLSYSQENLYSVPALGGDVTNLTLDFPHDLTGWHGVWWSSDALFLSAAIGTTTAVYRWQNGEFKSIIENDEHIHDFHVSKDGGLAYVASSAADVPELYWLALGASESIRLTDLNDDWLDKYAMAEVAVVSWESTDGLSIEGLMTYPTGYDSEQTYPLLLLLHGGPHARSLQETTSSSVSQAYAAEGFVVLSPNYRGSEGYGNEFSVVNRGDLGGGDYLDCMAGIDWAIAEGIADPNRLGILGDSYGGYLTNWAIGHTDRFKAAVSMFGIFSLMTDFSNSEAPRWETEYLNGYYWDNPQIYLDRSPSSYVSNINTPILILHGESDTNTFIANSQEMYTALRLQNKTAQYVRYPREGHGFAEPLHRLDEMRRCIAWFDKYLAAEGERVTHRIGDRLVRGDWELTVTTAALVTYTGRAESNSRYVEVTCVMRDIQETQSPLTITPGDMTLTRGLSSTGRSGRPIGLPIDVMGQKVLAEGTGWRFAFAPVKEERGLTVPFAVTFRISQVGGTFALSVKDFPPVTIEIPAADDKEPPEKATGEG